jgi:4-hydroxy-tetrahydrodipicolinate reductase
MSRVIVNGASGKMGQCTVAAIKAEPGLDLVAECHLHHPLDKALADVKADVVVDFTHPSVVRYHAEMIIKSGAHAIIGTTGLSQDDLTALEVLAKQHHVAVLVIPNFAIGAVLMMKFAAEAARHMPRVEIIEYHHDQKADAPSGTAIKTAELISKMVPHVNETPLVEQEIIEGARGGALNRIPIHSVRLPGYVASQEVILGGLGQTFVLRHDTVSRESFMPGVILCVKRVNEFRGKLVYGLENLL